MAASSANIIKNYEAAISNIPVSGKNVTCSDITKILKSLGYTVRNGKRGGHKVFFNDSVPGFSGSGYNCGHGRDPILKRGYVVRIRQELILHLESIR
jgi:hypothetical protein